MIREYAPDPSLNGMRLDEIASVSVADLLAG